ncbi:hypothetical protein Tdes44962_MAKER06005 [Teratosphaeria destructans]|uniref:Uncharacterized protein n=1 Tax=Teratosphaeria destructans TaxID=418781 RepID=A0A9W7VY78_9PEZI|nr:hypothetical protein Tdes44962_MAKER06005 [Teratosphaeria destructans]
MTSSESRRVEGPKSEFTRGYFSVRSAGLDARVERHQVTGPLVPARASIQEDIWALNHAGDVVKTFDDLEREAHGHVPAVVQD